MRPWLSGRKRRLADALGVFLVSIPLLIVILLIVYFLIFHDELAT
jgi:hypothetical protein